MPLSKATYNIYTKQFEQLRVKCSAQRPKSSNLSVVRIKPMSFELQASTNFYSATCSSTELHETFFSFIVLKLASHWINVTMLSIILMPSVSGGDWRISQNIFWLTAISGLHKTVFWSWNKCHDLVSLITGIISDISKKWASPI